MEFVRIKENPNVPRSSQASSILYLQPRKRTMATFCLPGISVIMKEESYMQTHFTKSTLLVLMIDFEIINIIQITEPLILKVMI